MNWVDWLLIGFLVVSVIGGFVEGFIRIGIGFAALILGFVLASWFHGVAGGWMTPYIHSKAAASVLGFLMIFIAILAAGGLTALIVQRVFRVAGLSWLDRLVGGAFGFVRGLLVLAIAALLVSAFFPRKLPAAVSQSEYAPYVFSLSKVLSEITPYEIKNSFEESYQEFTTLIEGMKKNKRAPLRYD
jgi:membrane protein required for colicin V production